MDEKVQMESELQAQIAGLQYQLDLKHQQQQNKAAAFSWFDHCVYLNLFPRIEKKAFSMFI